MSSLIADHERNFRAQYYEKVGFRTAEEKKSIETLLSEQPIVREKLRDFCCQSGIPAMYRIYVWKLLLGVLPLHSTNQEFVWSQREHQVRELERAYILLASESLDACVPQKMLKMKLIEEGCLPLQDKLLDSDPNNQYYLSIVRAMNGLVGCDVDLYWISTRFFHYLSAHVYPLLPMYPQYALQCLRMEDQDQRLFQHLSDHLVISALPCLEWFHICFSNVLPESSLEFVWDRVISGCSAILVYFAVAILLVLKRPLMAMHTTQDMLNILKKIPDDCGDKIINEAMDLLHKYGDKDLHKKLKRDSSSADNIYSLDLLASRRNSAGAGLVRSKTFGSDSVEATVIRGMRRQMYDEKNIVVEISKKSSSNTGDKNE